METKQRNSSCINHHTNKKCNEEKINSLWSLFDVRLPVLCHKLLTDNHPKDPQVTCQGRSKQYDLDLHSKKPRLIMVKSAKCQVDLMTSSIVPSKGDTALAETLRPKHQRKRKEIKNLSSECDCSDNKTSDKHLLELDLNEKGAEIKNLEIKYGIGNSLKGEGNQHNSGITNLEMKKIRNGNKVGGVERAACDMDKAGATGVQFLGYELGERTQDVRDGTIETAIKKKQSKVEFPQKQNRTVDTNQLHERENHREQPYGPVPMNQIHEKECLKEQTIGTIDKNQIKVHEPKLSKEQKNTVEISKIHETQKLDYIQHDKIPKCTIEEKHAEIQDYHLTNHLLHENEPITPTKTYMTFGNRDTLMSEENKSETIITNTVELDTSPNYLNATTETCRNHARQMKCSETTDTMINNNGTSETDSTNNLGETVCKEELDNAANEEISKAGCKEEQDNRANDEKNTSETMLTEQHNNMAPSLDNVKGAAHKHKTNEMYKDKVTTRNNTSETELSEQPDNTSKKRKITLRHLSDTAECDMNDLSMKLRLNVMPETETLKQIKNVKSKEEYNLKEEVTRQMSKLDDPSKTELAKQKEFGDTLHKIWENEETMITSNATRQLGREIYDKNQQKECRPAEKYDKLEAECKVEKEQKTQESKCKSEHDLSQQEYRKESELNHRQTDCRKELTMNHPDYRKEKCDISQPEYTKVPELMIDQNEYRKEHDPTQQEGRKELDSQQIKSSKTHHVSQPEYKKEQKTSQSDCTTEIENKDIDNDLKLVINDNLATDERQNHASATTNHHEQNTTAGATDLQAISEEWGSKRTPCTVKHNQENYSETSECGKCEGAANIETNTDMQNSDDFSTHLENYQQTRVLPEGPALSHDRSDLVKGYDSHRTQKTEMSNLDHKEISAKLSERNENMIHQTADNSNLGTHLLAFEAETQVLTAERSSPQCGLSAKTDAVSDSIRKVHQTSTHNSTKNNLKSCAKKDVLVLLPPVCNNATKNPMQGISGMQSSSSCTIPIPSNSSTLPKESRAFIQMVSRRLSAYVLDSKTNTARIVPLDGSINCTVEQGDNNSAVFSEDIYFQNCRLRCQTSEDRRRRVSSIDPRCFQSNQIEELRSGSSRRSRSESLTRRCALNKEWEILTKTTREELTILSPPKQSSNEFKECISSTECYSKCLDSSKLQHSQASPVLHESISLQPLCTSVTVDNKFDRNSNQTELKLFASPEHRTEMEKPICCSRATKTGYDAHGSGDIQKSASGLFTGAMQECSKQLAGYSTPQNVETPVTLGIYSSSFVDANTSNKLITNICQQCGDSSKISWCNTNSNPRHSEVLPDICMKTNYESPPFSPTEQDFFKTDILMSDLNCCDTETLARLNSKQSRTETGYISTKTELVNDSSLGIPIKTNNHNSHQTGYSYMNFGEKKELFSQTKTEVGSDPFVEVTNDTTNIKAKDVVIQSDPHESREVFTQTEANDFTEQSQAVVLQHAAHSTLDTRKANSKERNFTSVDNIRFQQSAYSTAHPMKYGATEEARNVLEKLHFIQNNAARCPTSTNSGDMVQSEILFGGLIAKQLAGYIFYKDKRNSRMPCRTNVKSEIRRSSSLSDVQTDLQNTLDISEKLGTLLETGQTVLVLKLPHSDCCSTLP